MFKGNRKFYFILAIGVLLLIVVETLKPKPISWHPTFSKNDKIPYGSFVLHELLGNVFPNKSITTANNPVFNTLSQGEFQTSNYLFFNETFQPDELDTEQLLGFVAKGNNVFVAANYYEGKLADTLNIETDVAKNLFYQLSQHDSLLVDSVQYSFSSNSLQEPRHYSFLRVNDNFFSSVDSTNTNVIGRNKEGSPNFIKTKFGKGSFFLHTCPRAFSNYYLTDSLNSSYAFKALSHLPIANIIWDEYYKYGRQMVRTPMRFVLSNPPLKTAYWLLLISALIFALLGLKREQRMIPVVKPYPNTSLQFVDTIGTLYFQKGDHRDIVAKKIIYFLEQIRAKFNLDTHTIDNSFYNRLSKLSGVPKREITWMFGVFDSLKKKLEVTPNDLIKLNKQIEQFNQKSKR